MKIKITLLIAFLFLSFLSLFPAEKQKIKYEGFSGGMMLHTGYVEGDRFQILNPNGQVVSEQNMKGMPYGIGGAVKIHLGKHLRIGSEGYVSTLNYGKNKSFSITGWGGVLLDCVWQLGKVAPFVGGTLGGGSVKNITLQNKYGKDFISEENASYRKYGFLAIAPFVGIECALTQKIRLTFKVDFLLNASDWQKDFVTGPRFYIGFMFYRLKAND